MHWASAIMQQLSIYFFIILIAFVAPSVAPEGPNIVGNEIADKRHQLAYEAKHSVSIKGPDGKPLRFGPDECAPRVPNVAVPGIRRSVRATRNTLPNYSTKRTRRKLDKIKKDIQSATGWLALHENCHTKSRKKVVTHYEFRPKRQRQIFMPRPFGPLTYEQTVAAEIGPQDDHLIYELKSLGDDKTMLDDILGQREVTWEFVAAGKQLFILLDGGKVVLRVHLNLQGEFVYLTRAQWNEIIAHAVPIRERLEHGELVEAYLIPQHYFPNARGHHPPPGVRIRNREAILRPMFSIVGDEYCVVCLDFNRMVTFDVICSPNRPICRADLEPHRSRLANVLLGEYGPSLWVDFSFAWSNILEWRKSVLKGKFDNNCISHVFGHNKRVFNGIGAWLAGDCCAFAGVDSRTPVSLFCANDRAFNRLKAYLQMISSEDYICAYAEDCHPYTTHENPFTWQQTPFKNFASSYCGVYRKGRTLIPLDLFCELWETGMLDPEHIQGAPYVSRPLPKLQLRGNKVYVDVVQLTVPGPRGKPLFRAYTFIRAQPPKPQAAPVQPMVGRKRKRDEDEEYEDRNWRFTDARVDICGLDFIDVRDSVYVTVIGGTDFHYRRGTRLSALPPALELMEGNNARVSNGLGGAPNAFRASRRALLQLESEANYRRARVLVSGLAAWKRWNSDGDEPPRYASPVDFIIKWAKMKVKTDADQTKSQRDANGLLKELLGCYHARSHAQPSTTYAPMGPPPTVPFHAQFQGSAYPSSQPPRGYTPAHTDYQPKRAMVARRAYAVVQQLITLKVSLQYLTEGKKGSTLLKNIQDALHDVPADIKRPDVKGFVFQGLQHAIHKQTFGYPFNLDDFELRGALMVDYEKGDPDEPLFYDQCFQAVKGKEDKFKNNMQFVATLVISPELHESVTDHVWAKTHGGTPDAGVPASSQRAQGRSARSTRSASAPSWPTSAAPSSTARSSAPRRPSRARVELTQEEEEEEPTVSLRRSNRKRPNEKQPDDVPVTPPAKRFNQTRPQPRTTQELSQAHPPSPRSTQQQSQPSQVASTDYTPDRDEVMSALRYSDHSTGQAITPRSEDGDFLPVPVNNFATLVKNRQVLIVNWQQFSYQAHLRVDESSLRMLGPPGSFKTAHPARLTMQEHVAEWDTVLDKPFELGKPVAVAAKRWYVSANAQGGIARAAKKTEAEKLSIEATCLMWATALLSLSYDYIHKVIADSEENSHLRDLEFPELRFVMAGLFKIRSSDPKRQNICYLIEELITHESTETDQVKTGFVKFVHNSSARPVPHTGEHAVIAKFLCFCQHIQYIKTGRLAFVSDYQGNTSLLTDPQIMTDPELGNLFGDGNVGSNFVRFPEEHVCEELCHTFALPSLRPTKARVTDDHTTALVDKAGGLGLTDDEDDVALANAANE